MYMSHTEILINGVSVDIKDITVIPINLQVSDIKNIESRNSSYTKTIVLAGTKNNNLLFSNIYKLDKDILSDNPNIQFNSDFNPLLKVPIQILKGGVSQFEGYMRLKKISKVGDEILYEIDCLASLGNFINDNKNKKLTDLNMSEGALLPLSGAVLSNTHYIQSNTKFIDIINLSDSGFTNTVTEGKTYYCTPLIDYGYTTNTENGEFDIKYLYPSFSLRSYIDRMFYESGYNLKSNFFDTKFFKSLIVPYNDVNTVLSERERANRTFYAGISTSGKTIFYQNINLDSYGKYGVYANNLLFTFENEVAPYFDNNNLYNNLSGGTIQIKKTGYYNFDVVFSITYPSTFTYKGTNYQIEYIQRANSFNIQPVTNLNLGTVGGRGDTTLGNFGYTVNSVYQIPNRKLKAGSLQQFRLAISAQFNIRNLTTNQLVLNIPSNVIPFNLTFNFGNSLKMSPNVNTFEYGDELDLNSYIPKEIKCVDLFKDVITQFNLIIENDKNDTEGKTLNIEPAIDYFQTGKVIDMTDKQDLSKGYEIIPINSLNEGQYIFSYKPDEGDYYNKNYTKLWSETFGQKTVDVQNDFYKNTNKIELKYISPTPCSSINIDTNIVIPKMYEADDNTGIKKSRKNNLRVLQHSKRVDLPSKTILMITGNTSGYTKNQNRVKQDFYWFSNMVDDKEFPQYDLCFDIPLQIYWTNNFIQSNYTNNNLYNRFYSQFIEENTSVNSKLVTMYFFLNELDINQFSFKDIWQIDGVNYRINKIIDYIPNRTSSVKVELVKIVSGNVFIPNNGIELDGQTAKSKKVIIGGNNEIQDEFATNQYNVIVAGIDAVKGGTNTSIIAGTGNNNPNRNIIYGGNDSI